MSCKDWYYKPTLYPASHKKDNKESAKRIQVKIVWIQMKGLQTETAHIPTSLSVYLCRNVIVTINIEKLQ